MAFDELFVDFKVFQEEEEEPEKPQPRPLIRRIALERGRVEVADRVRAGEPEAFTGEAGGIPVRLELAAARRGP